VTPEPFLVSHDVNVAGASSFTGSTAPSSAVRYMETQRGQRPGVPQRQLQNFDPTDRTQYSTETVTMHMLTALCYLHQVVFDFVPIPGTTS
jgi:hypothetical protein